MTQSTEDKTMRWHEAVELASPHVVRLETPESSGTGFFCIETDDSTLIGIATAAHVVDRALKWALPIRVIHDHSNTSILIRETERAIFLDQSRDTALIVIGRQRVPFPEKPLPLLDIGYFMKVGVRVGWLGYPGILGTTLCFFSGNISAVKEGDSYFIDGVAINGVSGGPVFHTGRDGGLRLVGLISAYLPNRQPGASLPGLAIAQDVTSLQERIKEFKDLESAKEGESKQPDPVLTPPVSPSENKLPTNR